MTAKKNTTTKPAATEPAAAAAAPPPEDAGEKTPNIVFVLRNENGDLDLTRAVEKFTHGNQTITVLKQDKQAFPFYHKDMEIITATFKRLYKPFVPKG